MNDPCICNSSRTCQKVFENSEGFHFFQRTFDFEKFLESASLQKFCDDVDVSWGLYNIMHFQNIWVFDHSEGFDLVLQKTSAGVIGDSVHVDVLDGDSCSRSIVISLIDCTGGASAEQSIPIEIVLTYGYLT